ncbi:MAG: ATP-grasp domain-containing protein [Candidatus Moraniibacteriota bacterium]|nr:MAG: ATP-grasp domain-containing protein [Candidatus Moranbacteria bacterium]
MKVLFLLGHQSANNHSKKFQSKFRDFFQYASERTSIKFYISNIEDYDTKQKLFSHAFVRKWNSWDKEFLVKPDIIYDKTSYFLSQKNLMEIKEDISQNFRFLNPLEFNRILTDKWETYTVIPDIHPKTILFQENDDSKKILDISSSLVVIKPRYGFGGKGVTVSTKENFKPIKTPFIVQEFIETSAGIPNITKGRHDLRIFLKNETPFYSIIRSPQKDPYIANINFGGALKVVPLEKIPRSAFRVINTISKTFSRFPKKLYSIDLFFDRNQNPWVVECNSRPGIILHKSELPYREFYYDHLLDFFQQSL